MDAKESKRVCGCKTETRGGVVYSTLCRLHWNESNARHELDRAVQWARHGRLDPDDFADRQVLRFFDQLCYWAAKGIGDAGSVGDIYSAASARRRSA